MKFGVCTGIGDIAKIRTAAQVGYDYYEGSFSALYLAEEDVYEKMLAANKEYGIKMESANCFIMGELPVTGSNVDLPALREYLKKGFSRAAELGMKTAVFGSGGARAVRDGQTYGEAFVQIVDFIRDTAAPIAEEYGCVIVLEPLRKAECSIINTVKEGVMVAAATGRANVAGLGDLFHMVEGGDDISNITDCKGWVKHAHISNPVGDGKNKRIYPLSADEYDYAAFVNAMEAAGCLRCSIEASMQDDFDKIAAPALAVIKNR